MVIGQGVAIRQLQALRAPLNGLRPHAGPQVDAQVGVQRRSAQKDAFVVHLAQQIGLGQRRTLVGPARLFADHDDLPRKPLVPQGYRALDAGLARADDDDPLHARLPA